MDFNTVKRDRQIENMGTQPSMLKNVKRQIRKANKSKNKASADASTRPESWQDALRRLKLADIQKRAPGFYTASGSDKMKVRPYSDKTANGLARCIIDYLTFNGHDAQRINTTGTMRKIGGQMKWTYAGTRRGAADLHCIIRGRAVSIEIKIGPDKQSEAQIKEQARIEAAGGLYFVARSMPAFLRWYKQYFITFNNF